MADRQLRLNTLRQQLRLALIGPHILAFLPALVLGAFWIGGETWLLAAALGLPLVFALLGGFGREGPKALNSAPLPLEELLQTHLNQARAEGQKMAVFFLAIDEFDELTIQYGLATAQKVLAQIGDRLEGSLRQGDHVIHRSSGQYVIVTAPVRHLDLEVALQMARRFQDTVQAPVAQRTGNIYLSCSIGFVLDQQVDQEAATELVDAGDAALTEARANGPSALRAFTPGLKAAFVHREVLMRDAERALEGDQIRPWFQPQLSTDTGQISGFEALARWEHPQRGLVPPADFLPALERAGLMQRLSEVILGHALRAVQIWDQDRLGIPRVGINFTSGDLRDPNLAERIKWDLDRFDLTPNRLSIEVLETVVAGSPDDVIARNVAALADLGCHIDLDDFGTGHASITSIRRFAVKRLKIDRSFVAKVDRDPEQQKMVTAILSMAEQLGLDTLAEGVETAAEHSMLAQLGCKHIQGFVVARPMPFEMTSDWIRSNSSSLRNTPRIGRGAG